MAKTYRIIIPTTCIIVKAPDTLSEVDLCMAAVEYHTRDMLTNPRDFVGDCTVLEEDYEDGDITIDLTD